MEKGNQAEKPRNKQVLNCLYQKPHSVFKLICFPWAGSGSMYLANWGENMNDLVEVYAVRLAGRESRIQEPFAQDIYQIADEIICALLPVIQDKSFAFFGHSLGSYIAFVTALLLKEKHNLEPLHLFLSSIPPPYSKYRPMPELDHWSDEELKQFLLICGGTPKMFANDMSFLKEHMPIMKKDMNLLTHFVFDKPSKANLSCDLTCLVGAEDIVMDIEDWKSVTSGSFDTRVLPGDHFYFMEPANEKLIQDYIVNLWKFCVFLEAHFDLMEPANENFIKTYIANI